MPNASELARQETEIEEDGSEQAAKALAYDTLVARAKRYGFDSVDEALDYTKGVKRGEL